MPHPCPACADPRPATFFDLPAVPVFCNILSSTQDQARAVPRGDISLASCPACGLIFNAAFNPALITYSGTYENALHFSPHFRAYAQSLAQDLVSTCNLRRKRLVELGCGDGSFLSTLCQLGDNRGTGFDPAFDPARAGPLDPRVIILQKLYGPDTAGEPADFVCCRHVLEHIERPLDFMRHVRRTVGNRPDTIVFFEVPDVAWTLEQLGIWDIIYEHCNYFSAPALRRLFAAAGLEPIATSSVYAGQFLTIRARPIEPPASFPRSSDPDDERFRSLIARFGQRQRAKVAEWRSRLADLAASGRRAVLWGAGSKGVTFLNTLAADPAAGLSHIVDVNPRKHGHFVAGTGQEIIPPQRLTALKPDAVIIMNPVYHDEIAAQLADLNVHAQVLEA